MHIVGGAYVPLYPWLLSRFLLDDVQVDDEAVEGIADVLGPCGPCYSEVHVVDEVLGHTVVDYGADGAHNKWRVYYFLGL